MDLFQLIPLESGELCVTAIATALSDNSKQIVAAQKIDKDISTVRNWISSGQFPECVQDFAPASYELKSYWIGRRSLYLDEEDVLWRTLSAAGSRSQLVVPMSLRDTVFNDSHHTTYGGHFGMTHTHSKIQWHYFWPGMSDFIRDKITACHKCVSRKSPVNRHQPMGHVPVSGKFERVAMDLLDVSVISGKGHKYILVVCDYFTKYTEAYPLADKTARSVADALMDKWLPTFGFPLLLHSDQGKEFDNDMVHKLSELLGTVKTKTTPHHPRSDGLVERFNRTLLAMLAMFVSREYDNWDDLLPFMMLAYNTTVHTSTGFTPHRLVFGEECSLPGNLVHRELRPDPPPPLGILVITHHGFDRHSTRRMMKCARSNNEPHIARKGTTTAKLWRAHSPLGDGYLDTTPPPPARKSKLCSPWIGPYKIVRAPMEWVVGIQVDADARIFYVHMDDLKRCAPPEPAPSWPDVVRGTSIVLSMRAPSTFAPTQVDQSPTESGGAQQTASVTSNEDDARASVITDQSEDIPADTNTPPKTVWDLQDANCILSKNSECCIDFRGFQSF